MRAVDAFGRAIIPGDRIIYVTRHGSSTTLHRAIVKGVTHSLRSAVESVVVHATVEQSGSRFDRVPRDVKLTAFHNLAVIS